MSVYTITVTLTSEEDAALRARALQDGRTAEELLGQAARVPIEAEVEAPLDVRNARLIALLDTFEEGDAETQAHEYAALKAGLDAGRPGQRRLFGEGFNP